MKDPLQSIPGVGPSVARMLRDVGINEIGDLKNRDPRELYDRLNEVRGERLDPCVLYTFRCAVYFASEPNPEPEKLKWWNWKDRTSEKA